MISANDLSKERGGVTMEFSVITCMSALFSTRGWKIE